MRVCKEAIAAPHRRVLWSLFAAPHRRVLWSLPLRQAIDSSPRRRASSTAENGDADDGQDDGERCESETSALASFCTPKAPELKTMRRMCTLMCRLSFLTCLNLVSD